MLSSLGTVDHRMIQANIYNIHESINMDPLLEWLHMRAK